MQNTKIECGSGQRTPVVLPEMEQLLPPLSAEQLSALSWQRQQQKKSPGTILLIVIGTHIDTPMSGGMGGRRVPPSRSFLRDGRLAADLTPG